MVDNLDKYYDEDSVDFIPTFDRYGEFLELLQEVTTLDVEEDGTVIPTWVSAADFAALCDLELDQAFKLAKENNFIVYLVKILGEELPADLYIICAPGCDEQLIKDDYKEYYELDIELELVEDDKEEQNETEDKDEILEDFSINQKVYDEIKDDLFSPTNRYNPISDIKNVKDRPKVIGWLVANVKAITITIPKDLKNIFDKRFKYKGPGLILFNLEPGSSAAQQYNYDKFRDGAVIKLKSKENCPKELSYLIEENKQDKSISITHLGLIKILVDEYGFTFGERIDEMAESLKQKLFETKYTSIEMQKKFNEGYYTSLIDRANADLKVEYKIDVVNKGEEAESIDDWLQKHVTNITIRVPSAVEETFVKLYTDEVKYSVIDSTAKTSGGNPMIYGISAAVFVDTLDGLPQILWGIFDNKREVHNTNFALSLIRDYGPRFFEKNSKRSKKDVNEENELEKRARKHKKTDKKGARGWFVNPNAGNVEQNIKLFNKAMGGSSSSSSDSSSEGIGESKENYNEQKELTEVYPTEGESKTEFVARFMKEMEDEYENPKQRYAVALSYWEKKE